MYRAVSVVEILLDSQMCLRTKWISIEFCVITLPDFVLCNIGVFLW